MKMGIKPYLALLLLGSSATAKKPVLGIAVSGGSGTYTSVEVFVPSTGQSWDLPDLPKSRVYHTMDSLLVCGGETAYTSCDSLSDDGTWTTHDLLEERSGHSSWNSSQGLVLMGRGYSASTSTSEWVTGERKGEYAFPMKHDTVHGCAITHSDYTVLTGGILTKHLVSMYSVGGWEEDLPSLREGRYNHGCGSYLESDGTRVMLVAGGSGENYMGLSSTEILVEGATAWSTVTPLPRYLDGPRIVMLNNKVYLTGGQGFDGHRQEVLKWNPTQEEWKEKGKLKIGRSSHGATAIEIDEDVLYG